MKKNGEEKRNINVEKLKASEVKLENSTNQKSSENPTSSPADDPKENVLGDIDALSDKYSPPSNPEPQIISSKDAESHPELSEENIIEQVEKIEGPTEKDSKHLSSTSKAEELDNALISASETTIEKNILKTESESETRSDDKSEGNSIEDKKILNKKEDEDKNDISPAKKAEILKDSAVKITDSEQKKTEDKGSDADISDEEEQEEEHHLDYSNYTKKQIVQVLESLLKEDDFSQVGRILKVIKKPYDKIENTEQKEAFDKYIDDGGEKDGFEYHLDELDQRFLKAYGKLKERKNQYFNSLEKHKDQNLKIKLEILEKIRELVDSEETGVSIKSLKELQKQWKEVGVIPPSQIKSLWANYNALLDRFYDQRSIYFELKELDRKKNYDLKIEICEKAEQLTEENDIRDIIKQLNELHEEFKHIGPVPKEDQEGIWERFKAASDKIYSRRKEYYEKLKDEFKINELAKEALIEKVIPFTKITSDRISDWNSKTKEIIEIQKEWEAIGSLPKEKARSINKLFWSSFKSFFTRKGQFFKKIDEERKENLKVKQELVEQAEVLKDSDDFRATSDELKRLQKRWKEIGPVPEKYRNEVFLQFKKACDHFFDRRRTNSGKVEKDYEENLQKKQLLCEELEIMTKSEKIDIDRVKSIEAKWGEIGFVPKSNIRSTQKRFTDAIEKVTDKIDLPESEKHKLRFSAQFNKMNYGPGAEKLIQKKEGALRRQISSLENDINLWINNIDFFASSKNADKLKEEFQVKIDKATAQLNSMKEQLKVIINI